MKKIYEKGFFLSETMVVMAVVAIILVAVFKLFSTTYIKFQESEKYNTVNSINALSNVKKYLESFGKIEAEELLGSNAFIEITDSLQYASTFYQSIKEEYDIDSVYIIDMSLIKSNLSNLNVQFKNYINSLPDSNNKVLLINVKGNEFTSISISSELPTLVGNSADEYAVYIEQGEEFVDPGYTNWEGEEPETTWESPLDINTIGTYYLKYNFDNYILRRKVKVFEKEYDFNYTGYAQKFIVPATGIYQIELWGAAGGRNLLNKVENLLGGKGGYTKGIIHLNEGERINVYVGGKGSDGLVATVVPGGWNGGGTGDYDHNDDEAAGGGGGATDIRYNDTSLKSRIMVAGGGGGAANAAAGGFAGGLVGENTTYSSGGTQVVGYSFGNGQDGVFINSNVEVGGGGGGYYGGESNSSGAASTYKASGAGGSSFISGYTGCVAVTLEGFSKEGCTDGTTDTSCSIHYSNKIFTEMEMKAGNELMPTHDGKSIMTGNDGDGYAKITFID